MKRSVAGLMFACLLGVQLLVVAPASGATLDPARVEWRIKVPLDYFSHTPGVGPDGTIYIPIRSGTQAVNPDGTTKWTFPAGGTGSSISVGTDGTVYVAGGGPGAVGGTDGIFAINPNGTLKWAFTATRDYLLAGPNIGPDGNLYAVTDSTGIGLFSLTPAGNRRFATGQFHEYGSLGLDLAFGPDRVYFGFDMVGAGSPTFFAYDFDGSLAWTVNSPDDPPHPAAGPNGHVVFLAFPTSVGKSVWSYSPDGAPVFRFYEFPGNVQESPDVGPDNVIYVTRNFNTLLALTPSGAVKWRDVAGGMMFAPRVDPTNTTVFMGGRITYGQPGFYRAFTTGGALRFEVPLPTEPGFGDYGQLVPSSIPVFSPDGTTAYSIADVAGDDFPEYAYLYAIDLSSSTLSTAPTAPVDLIARALPSDGVRLSWRDTSSNETGFSIWRCAGANCGGLTKIASVSANIRRFTDIPLAAGTYVYRVKAFNAVGASAFSNRISVRAR